jgi:Response regulator receiver domain.
MQQAFGLELTYKKQVKKEKRKIYFKEAKILLVEDNQMNQELAVSLLNSVGLTAMVAENGKQAIEKTQGKSLRPCAHGYPDACNGRLYRDKDYPSFR